MSDLVGQPVPWGHQIPVMAINFVPLSVLGAPIILFSVQGPAGCGFGVCWTLCSVGLEGRGVMHYIPIRTVPS